MRLRLLSAVIRTGSDTRLIGGWLRPVPGTGESDKKPQGRSEVCRGPMRYMPGWAVQQTVHLREDPGGWGTKGSLSGVRGAHACSSGAERRYSRREAAAGRVVPRVYRGMVERSVWLTRMRGWARCTVHRPRVHREGRASGGWANVTRIP